MKALHQGQRGESLISLLIAVGIFGLVAAGMATVMMRQNRASSSLTAKDDELGLRQEIRERADCKLMVGGRPCTGALPVTLPLIDHNGHQIGAKSGSLAKVGAWTVRAYCQASLVTIDAARIDQSGSFRKDALNPGSVDVWRTVTTSRELDCGTLFKNNAGKVAAGCLVGKTTTLCPRSVFQPVADVGGTYGGFAACAPGEMPYSCGFTAGAAYTIGPTYAFQATIGGAPGCICNIGVLDTTDNGTCPGGGCSPCTGGAWPGNGCGSYCTALCVRAQ